MPRTNGVPKSPDECRARRSEENPIRQANNLLQSGYPRDVESEIGVIAALMLAPWHMDELWTRLTPDDFFAANTRAIYTAIRNVHAAGLKLDIGLVCDRLKRANQLDEPVGGMAALMEMFERLPHGENVFFYADKVKDCAMRRDVAHAALKALTDACRIDTETRTVMNELETAIGDLSAARSIDKLHLVGDLAASSMHRITNKKPPRTGIKTGLHALDALIGGYCGGHFNVIAARTSVGKTALATSHVTHWLENTEFVGYFCSVEMGEEEVVERILCNMAGIDTYRFRNHWIGENEIARMRDAVTFMNENKRLWIDHAPRRNVSEIVSNARRVLRYAGRLDYVIVDYLQLLDADSQMRFAKRHEQVADISRRLKIAAKELDVPFIVLAQLNRSADEGRPKLSHLRESGAIEQDADKVIFIDRPTDEGDERGARAELIVAKNRHGRVGECSVAFFGNYQRFQSMKTDAEF